MEVAIPAVGQIGFTYVFYFFTCKNYSAEVAILVAKTFLFKIFLVIFPF